MHLSEYRRFAQQAALTYPDTFHWVTDGVLDGKEILKFVTKTFPAVKFGRIIIRTYEGEKYIIFKGYAGLRTIFTGTRYRADNVKIVDLMVGEAGIVKSAVEGTALSVVVVSVIDVLQAYLSDDEMLKEDLPFTLAIDALKTLAATVVGLAAGLALVGTGIACAPVAGVIVVGICVAWTLNHFFPTEQIADEMRRWFDRQLQKEQTFLAHAGHLITEADHLWREIGKAATTLDHVYTRAEQEILNLVNPLRGF